MNTCFNAVDVHVQQGRGNQPALIYDSPVTNTIQNFTYQELQDRVAGLPVFLKDWGFKKGIR